MLFMILSLPQSSPPAKKLKRLVDKESSCTKPTHQPKRQKTPTPPCSTSPPPHSHTPPTPNLAKHDIKNFVTDPSLPPPVRICGVYLLCLGGRGICLSLYMYVCIVHTCMYMYVCMCVCVCVCNCSADFSMSAKN